MDFENWRHWSGTEMAFFVTVFCDLPEYQKPIEQNLSGASVVSLRASNLLPKGLVRAGVCDRTHHCLIEDAFEQLCTDSPEELNRKLHHLIADQTLKKRLEDVSQREKTTKSNNHLQPKASPPKRTMYRCSLGDSFTLTYKPELHPCLDVQPSLDHVSHDSTTRFTPRLFHADDKSNAPSLKPHPPVSKQSCEKVSPKMRKCLARNLKHYETIGGFEQPLYGSVARPSSPQSTHSTSTGGGATISPRSPHSCLLSGNGSDLDSASPSRPARGYANNFKSEEIEKKPAPHCATLSNNTLHFNQHANQLAGNQPILSKSASEVYDAVLQIQSTFRGRRVRKTLGNGVVVESPPAGGFCQTANVAAGSGLYGVRKIKEDRLAAENKKLWGETLGKDEAQRAQAPGYRYGPLDTMCRVLAAATKLQSAFRGHISRKNMKSQLEQVDSLEATP
eukprot:TRINITY_DN38901_c0_g1_i1.p1 TRINITY_DN38901_c0_g1~~TRINITY_DN38901_c0_g1_i1.p1  ORF type:complete len:448 (-),score=58.88 TRINITY_DN38901_c0_g1_i1:64-1407(-)